MIDQRTPETVRYLLRSKSKLSGEADHFLDTSPRRTLLNPLSGPNLCFDHRAMGQIFQQTFMTLVGEDHLLWPVDAIEPCPLLHTTQRLRRVWVVTHAAGRVARYITDVIDMPQLDNVTMSCPYLPRSSFEVEYTKNRLQNFTKTCSVWNTRRSADNIFTTP